METKVKTIVITVQALIQAPVNKVWKLWTDPNHIVNWCFASDDWHAPIAENDLKVDGKFLTRMEAKDGSSGFDFAGKYTQVELYKQIAYILDDGRKVQITFTEKNNETTVQETFEAENLNSIELQETGWQAILDTFKKYVETTISKEELHFEIIINASPEKVYKTMLDKEGYSEWTAAFTPTSYFMGSWEKGSKILFIGTDEDGKVGGMVSKIRENIPNKYVGIDHVGVIQGDQELTSGPEVEKWAGISENYTFTENNGTTLLSVDLGINDEFEAYMLETYPKALKLLKAICEK
ncbi:MAG: SRPBCC family protein [Paludibacter sp.]|nr:SRPBCC family protein [Paludibacter sp.]